MSKTLFRDYMKLVPELKNLYDKMTLYIPKSEEIFLKRNFKSDCFELSNIIKRTYDFSKLVHSPGYASIDQYVGSVLLNLPYSVISFLSQPKIIKRKFPEDLVEEVWTIINVFRDVKNLLDNSIVSKYFLYLNSFINKIEIEFKNNINTIYGYSNVIEDIYRFLVNIDISLAMVSGDNLRYNHRQLVNISARPRYLNKYFNYNEIYTVYPHQAKEIFLEQLLLQFGFLSAYPATQELLGEYYYTRMTVCRYIIPQDLFLKSFEKDDKVKIIFKNTGPGIQLEYIP